MLTVILEAFGVSHHAVEEVDLRGSDILITGTLFEAMKHQYLRISQVLDPLEYSA